MSLLLRRRGLRISESTPPAPQYAITKATNPEVMDIVYAQGWAASEDYMTMAEAAAVTSIGTAFFNNATITHFEEFQYFTGITSLANNAFRATSNLKSIVLPPSLTSIGDRAFQQSGITSIDFANVTTFGNYIYLNCTSLLTATFQAQTTSIGASLLQGCTSLISVTCYATTPPEIASNTFYNTNNCAIYVPSGSVSDYQAADFWSGMADRIQAIPE